MGFLTAVKNMARHALGRDSGQIRLTLDFLSYGEMEAVAYGWAFSADGDVCEIFVTDADGRDVPVKTDRDRREDVCAAFGLAEEAEPGFRVSIDMRVERKLPYTLCARSGKHLQKLPLMIETDRSKRIALWEQYLTGRKTAPPVALIGYDDWRFSQIPSEEELAQQRETQFSYAPVISIAVPLYNTPQDYLEAMIDSALAQTYGRFELCLADGSTTDAAGAFIRSRYEGEERIIYRRLDENRGISENTNEAIRMASGDFLMLADHDDVLEPQALYRIVEAMQDDPETVDLVYTDEDKISFDSSWRFDPSLKPDYDPAMLRSFNYFTHITVIRMSIVREEGGERTEYDGAQDYDFTLRCAEKARRVVHVRKILYHWRAHPLSTAGNPRSKLYAYENGRKAIEAHLRRLGLNAHAEMLPFWGRYAIHFDDTPEEKISVILLGDPRNYEKTKEQLAGSGWIRQIITADGPSGEAVNRAVLAAEGEKILFLRSGAVFAEEGALTDLSGLLDVPGCGFAGTMSVFGGKISSAGYILAECGPVAILPDTSEQVFTFSGMTNLTHGISAVSSACLMIRADVLTEAGGWPVSAPDEESAAIDLCIRVRQAGRYGVMHPYARVGIPPAGTPQMSPEGKNWLMKRHHKEMESGDPYFHPFLDPSRGDFVLRGQFVSENAEVNGYAAALAKKALLEAGV